MAEDQGRRRDLTGVLMETVIHAVPRLTDVLGSALKRNTITFSLVQGRMHGAYFVCACGCEFWVGYSLAYASQSKFICEANSGAKSMWRRAQSVCAVVAVRNAHRAGKTGILRGPLLDVSKTAGGLTC